MLSGIIRETLIYANFHMHNVSQLQIKNSLRPRGTLCFYVLSVGSLLTCCGVWWSKLQRVSQHIVVVPDIKLVVSGVVVHRGNVLIGVGKSDADRLLTGTVGIVGVHD